MAAKMEVDRNVIMNLRDCGDWKNIQKMENEGLHGFFLYEAKLELALDDVNDKKNINQMFDDNTKVDYLKNKLKDFATLVQTSLQDNSFESMKDDIKLVWAKSLVFLRDRRLGIKYFHQIEEPPLTARLRTLALYAELSFIQAFTIIKDVHMKIKFSISPNAWWFVLTLIRRLNEKASACLGKTVARAEKPLPLPPIVWRRSDYMLGVAAYLRAFQQNNSTWPFNNDDSTSYLGSIQELSYDYFQYLHFGSAEAYKQSEEKIKFLSAIHEPAETIIHLAADMQGILNNFEDFYLQDLANRIEGTLPKIINYHLDKKLDIASSLTVPKVENDGGEVIIRELDGQGVSPIIHWGPRLLTETQLLKQKPLEGISLYLLDTLTLPTTTWKECIMSASGSTAEHDSPYTVAIDRDGANVPRFMQEAEFLKILLKVLVCGNLDGKVGNFGSIPPNIVLNP